MKVLRHEVPVDDHPHEVECGRIVHVACRVPDTVDVWALDAVPRRRRFLIVGTDQAFPGIGEWMHVGTALSPGGHLVWHLLEEYPPTEMEPF